MHEENWKCSPASPNLSSCRDLAVCMWGQCLKGSGWKHYLLSPFLLKNLLLSSVESLGAHGGVPVRICQSISDRPESPEPCVIHTPLIHNIHFLRHIQKVKYQSFSPICGICFLKKHESRRGDYLGRRPVGMGRGDKRKQWGEYDQSTLHPCMKMSQRSTLYCAINTCIWKWMEKSNKFQHIHLWNYQETKKHGR
jgi:hypothetical protein